MAILKSVTVQGQPTGSGFAAAPSEPNHVVRKFDLDAVVAPLEAAKHAALTVTDSDSVILTIPSGTQSMSASMRLKSGGGLGADAGGVFVVFGTAAGQAVEGDAFVTALAAKLNADAELPISQITNLADELNAKAPLVHSHAIGDIALLQAALDSKAPISGGKDIADITGLQTALDGKAALVHGHEIADVNLLTGALAAKSDTGHTHAAATSSEAGFLSAADKTKLDTLSQNTYWLEPVLAKENLPLNSGPVGACCLVKGEARIYKCEATVGFVDDQWTPIGAATKSSGFLGDGVAMVYDLTHGLATWDIVPAFQDAVTHQGLGLAWTGLDENTIRVTFSDAPPLSGVRWSVIG